MLLKTLTSSECYFMSKFTVQETIHTLPWNVIGISEEVGSLKTKVFKGKYEATKEFSEEWSPNQK